jgi:hypothetical protein
LSDLSLGQIFLRDIMSSFSYSTIQQGNVVGFGVAANTTTEAASQPHQVSVVERVF